jgi:hypothetical protein
MAGCGSQPGAPTEPAASPAAEDSSPTSDAAASPVPGSVEATATSQPDTGAAEAPPTSPPETGENAVFQDDFANPASGWDRATLGNYIVDYHEGGWYHIEINQPDRIAVSEPNKTVYDDITLALEVFPWTIKTAPEGTFRYGMAFRRTGNNYYAFTLSPSTRTWEMLKVSADGITKLKEGEAQDIQDQNDVPNLLRVDATGPNFLLYINDVQVDQVVDTSYANGEVGLYAENIDSPGVHIHFDKFTIEALKLSKTCSVPTGTVYVRSGPSTDYPQIAVLSSGDIVQAQGISPNQWVQIILAGSSEPGWVSYRYEGGELSCTPSIDLFPVINP